jgi:hypothetical protein
MGQLANEEMQRTRDPDLDRDLDELLQEIRVILPGVEVLFAFLFTLPFTQRFGEVTEAQRFIYSRRWSAPRWRRPCSSPRRRIAVC